MDILQWIAWILIASVALIVAYGSISDGTAKLGIRFEWEQTVAALLIAPAIGVSFDGWSLGEAFFYGLLATVAMAVFNGTFLRD